MIMSFVFLFHSLIAMATMYASIMLILIALGGLIWDSQAAGMFTPNVICQNSVTIATEKVSWKNELIIL